MVARAVEDSREAGGRGALRGAGHGPLDGLRRLTGQPRERAFSRLKYLSLCPLFALPFYRWTLGGVAGGRAPTALLISPSDPWPGDGERGRAFLRGDVAFLGRSLHEPAPFWDPIGVDRAWCAELHAFDWLRDLRAAGGDAARRAARDLVADWLERHRDWSPLAWDPAVTGRRLAAWLGQYDFFAGSAEVEFRHRLLGVMSRQTRHLARVLPGGLGGPEAIRALKGLILAGLALPGQEQARSRGFALLRRELDRQLLHDGGHASRSPAVQLGLLRDLIDLRAACHAAGFQVPADLQAAIEQMAPLLRLLRHADGGLALFNDSNEAESWLIDMALQRVGGQVPALSSAPASGFQRLQAGRALILVDAGAPPKPGHDAEAHAGTLSFELSVGRERFVVNCGAAQGEGEWRRAQRMTAAHSTLTLGDTNSSEITRLGPLGRRASGVSCRREEAEGNLWLDMSHDGYLASFGRVHHRRLFLSANGEDLRGEDVLEPAAGQKIRPAEFAIRFHLHPEVKATLAQRGDTVLMRLTKGGGWRLRARGAAIRLEPSIYLGKAGERRRSLQVVLFGQADDKEVRVKWALQREGKARPAKAGASEAQQTDREMQKAEGPDG